MRVNSSTHIVCAYSLVINKKKNWVELKLGYNNRDPRLGPLDYPSALKVCIKIITITKALIRVFILWCSYQMPS